MRGILKRSAPAAAAFALGAACLSGLTAEARDGNAQFRSMALYEQAVRDVEAGRAAVALERLAEAESGLSSKAADISALRIEALFALGRLDEARREYQRFFTLGAEPNLSYQVAQLSIRIDDAIRAERGGRANPASRDGSAAAIAGPRPVVRVAPDYPQRAAARGVEGDCTIGFDVSPGGMPANVRVVACSSPLFARSSVRAVERWRYNPQVVDGRPVWSFGVETSLEYELSQDG